MTTLKSEEPSKPVGSTRDRAAVRPLQLIAPWRVRAVVRPSNNGHHGARLLAGIARSASHERTSWPDGISTVASGAAATGRGRDLRLNGTA